LIAVAEAALDAVTNTMWCEVELGRGGQLKYYKVPVKEFITLSSKLAALEATK
jgi:hypothetical protein